MKTQIQDLKSDSEIYVDGVEKFLNGLLKKKTRVEVCDIITLDADGREIEVYYRVIDAPDSPQTDVSSDWYSIEQVTYKGRRVNVRNEEWLYDQLNLINPAKLWQ